MYIKSKITDEDKSNRSLAVHQENHYLIENIPT